MHDVSGVTARPTTRRNRRIRRNRRAAATAVLLLALGLGACSPAPVDVTSAADGGASPASAIASAHGTGLTPEALPVDRATAQSVTVAPPTSYDLTAWAPPPGDQGSVGSCVAWSIAYTALGWYQRHDGIAGGALAPMYTYAQLAQGRDNGSTFSGNLNIATSQGVDTQTDYVPQGNFDYTTQPTAAQRANAATWKLSGYRSLAIDQIAIETSISTNHPVVIGIPVYSNFYSVSTANRGLYTGATGSFQGYHALTALGYDATGLRIENSWGPRWGDGGFATLSWDFVRTGVFTAIEIGAFAPGAPTTTPTTSTTTTTTTRPATTTTTTRPVTTTTVRPTTTTTTAAPKAPTVTAVSPASGPLGGGQTITITGTGLANASAVTVGGRPATGLVPTVAGTSLKVTVPAGVAGTAEVIVVNPVGASRTATTATYRYVAPAVSRMTPASGPLAGGTRVTVTGSNLQGGTVAFGTRTLAGTASADGTSLSFVTPAGTGVTPVGIVVATTTVGAGSFAFLPAPTVTALSATRGRTNASTTIAIWGTNFTADTRVVVGSRALTPTVAADGRTLLVVIPAGAAGSAALTVTSPAGSSSPTTWTWY